jgi:hypothetical protein
MSKLTIDEVAAQLRKGVSGEVPLTLMDSKTWDDIYCGNVRIMFGDWEFIFFNDCWELDYVDTATAADGRTGQFDDWYSDGIDGPLGCLNRMEYAALEMMIERLPPQLATEAP